MKILTYGFLTHNDVMPKSAIRLGPVVLHGFKWEMLQFANIVKSPGNSLTGILWDIDETILEELDHREGFPNFYTRVLVDVEYESDSIEPVWVYMMTPESRKAYEGSAPSDHYFDAVTQGYAQDNLYLPEYYENPRANS